MTATVPLIRSNTANTVSTLATPNILGAYPETPAEYDNTTPTGNAYNQREGPLEEAGRNISYTSDNMATTQQPQQQGDSSSHLQPTSLMPGQTSKASSMYSQNDEVIPATNTNNGSRFAEDLPSSRPSFPEVSNASHAAVKDAPIDSHPNLDPQAQTGTSDSASKAFISNQHKDDSVQAGAPLRDDGVQTGEKSGATDLNAGIEAGSITGGIAALDIARAEAGAPFITTGIPENSTTSLPAVGPTNPMFRRLTDEKSLADSIPMPTSYLQGIKGSVPGGWNDQKTHANHQPLTRDVPVIHERSPTPLEPSTEDREREEHEANSRTPLAGDRKSYLAGNEGEKTPVQEEEAELSPEEYYNRARQQFNRKASFNSVQKTELDMVPSSTVSVSRDTMEQNNTGYPEEKRTTILPVADMERAESRNGRQTRFSTAPEGERSSPSLREHSNSGHGKAAVVGGLAGAGAGGYAVHRLDNDDRGYSAASQQPQFNQPQNNYMSGQAPSNNTYMNAGRKPEHFRQESRRSNIFDSMAGVPDPTAEYNQQPAQRATSVRNSESGQGRRSIRSIVGAPVGMDDQRADVPRSPSVHQSVREDHVAAIPGVQYHAEPQAAPVVAAPVEEYDEEYREPMGARNLSRGDTRKSMRSTRTTASRRSVIPQNPIWGSKPTKSTKYMPANPIWMKKDKPRRTHFLPMSPWEHDPPGYRRRRQEEKEEVKLKRKHTLPTHPFTSDKPKRRSTRDSRVSRTTDERPLSRGDTVRTNRTSFAPVALVEGRSETPNKLQKAQSVRSNRTNGSRRESSVPVTTTYPQQHVEAGELGVGYPTQPGTVIAQQKVGQDVIYHGGSPAVREGEIDNRRQSVSTAGVADSPAPLQWRERPQEQSYQQQPVQQSYQPAVQQRSQPSTRPTSMMEQPKYSYSGAATAPGVQRYPMQRGETGYDPAGATSALPDHRQSTYSNNVASQLVNGQPRQNEYAVNR